MARQILIVDDDEVYGAQLAAALQRSSFAVSRVLSAEDALKLLAQRDFDIVLTDIYMPGRDGIELLRMVRQLRPAALVIGMLGDHSKSAQAIRRLFQVMGGAAVISKPVHLAELLLVLASLPG